MPNGQQLSAEFQQLFTGGPMCFFQLVVKTALTGSFVRRKSCEEHPALMQQCFSGATRTGRIVLCKGTCSISSFNCITNFSVSTWNQCNL